MSSEDDFYNAIEDGVREWVRAFRNAGINTECSCGHEGYIQCQSLDVANDVERITQVLYEHGIETFDIVWSCSFDRGRRYPSLNVRCKQFKALLVNRASEEG